jgi:predicted esterase
MMGSSAGKPVEPGIQRGRTANPEHLVIHFHGMNENPESYTPLAEKLVADFPAALIDMPFVGMYGRKGDSLPPDRIRAVLKEQYAQFLKDRAMPQSSLKRTKNALRKEFMKPVVAYRTKSYAQSEALPYIEDLARHYGLPMGRVYLTGFSFGGGLAVYSGLLSPKAPGAVVSHSGGFLGGIFNPVSKPPVLMITDLIEREVLNGSMLDPSKALERLQKLGIPVTAFDFQPEDSTPHLPPYMRTGGVASEAMRNFLARHMA